VRDFYDVGTLRGLWQPVAVAAVVSCTCTPFATGAAEAWGVTKLLLLLLMLLLMLG
jgi:hypothetical protein